MKDFFGAELSIGDDVACITRHYRDLTLGTVVGVTPKQVRVEYTVDRRTETTLRYPAVLIKRPGA